MSVKKLAVIRSEMVRKCPFGLSIDLACKNAGDSVLRMQALDTVAPEREKLQKEHNVSVYSMYGEGRCVYADKLLPHKSVHCDYGDSGAGIRDAPMPTEQGYPRVWGAVGLTGYYSYPLAEYWDNPQSVQVFRGIYSSYAQNGEVRFNKKAWFCRPDAELLKVIELCEFRSDK